MVVMAATVGPDVGVKVKGCLTAAMRIGELAQRTGTTPRALRYYEQQGLLAPDRGESGYRDYDDAAVSTVGQIRGLLAAGLGTALIAEILPCLQERSIRPPGPLCPELRDGLAAERARITATIAALQQTRGVLDGLIAGGAPLAARLA